MFNTLKTIFNEFVLMIFFKKKSIKLVAISVTDVFYCVQV